MIDTDIRESPNTWEIVLLWTVANIVSIFGGILIGAILNDILWKSNLPPCIGGCIDIFSVITNPIQRAVVFGLAIGGVKSFTETLVLQKLKTKWKGWFPASMLGWVLGMTIAVGHGVFQGISNQLLGGMVIGLSQWFVLRQYLPKAHWWIIASTLGGLGILSYFPLGNTFKYMLENFIFFSIAGLFMGIMTGVTLSWLLVLSWLQEQ